MPHTLYCPSKGCGEATEYTTIKPTICPSCGKPFSAAFASMTPVVDKPNLAPTPRRRRPSDREVDASAATFMKPVHPTDVPPLVSTPEPAPVDELTDDEEYDNQDVDPAQVSAYAEQIKASINLGDIIVHDPDQPIKYRDWCFKKQ